MATPNHEQLAKQLLHAEDGRLRRASKPTSGKPKRVSQESGRPPRRYKIPHRLPSPTEEQLERREQGWNDRFTRDTPSQPKRPTRVHRAIDEATDNSAHKERKIREERRQYGHGDAPQQQRPGVGRLVPIAPLSGPPREPETNTSNEEKLRFNVLRAIDVRETLIYQLNALILCTPVQEAIVLAAPRVTSEQPQIKPRATMAIAPSLASPVLENGSVMNNSREAIRLAQQLGADLQMSGIHVVEGIVEWMLDAGAKADKPPEFLWRGRNYFMKMMTDLDFARPELHARGVELDCFTTGNPLCVRPEQKLGRVLAAQSIIKEMVELARPQLSTQGDATLSKIGQQKLSDRNTKPVVITPRSPHPEVVEQASEREPLLGNVPAQYRTSADELIVASYACDDQEEDGFSTSARSDGVEFAAAEESTLPLAVLRDTESEKELVNILDESFCEVTGREVGHQSDLSVRPSARSGKSSSRGDYENSFDADDEEELPHQKENGEAEHAVDEEPSGARSITDRPIHIDELPSSDRNASTVEIEDPDTPAAITKREGSSQGHDDVMTDKEEVENTTARKEVGAGASISDAESVFWDRAAAVLEANIGGIGDLSGLKLKEWVTWASVRRHELQAAVKLASWHDVQTALDGSFLHGVGAAWSTGETLAATLKSIEEFDGIKWAGVLVEQCQIVVDELCGGIANSLQRDLKTVSPLVSEVDISDVMESTEKLLDRDDIGSVLLWIRRSVEVILACHSSEQLLPVRGFSQLVQVFYPYLVNQRRDKLVHSWDEASAIFINKCGIDFEKFSFLLDASCKILLLNVKCLRRIRDEQNEGDALPVPKLALVCDRSNVLETSCTAVTKKCFASQGNSNFLPSYQVFPFFRSSFGEKIVDSERVEEGEGKGPLKEWFTLIAKDLIAKWRIIELPVGASDDFDPVLVNGNRMVVDRLDHSLKPGYKVEWLSPIDGTIASRIINACDGSHGTYVLDRGGISNQSFNVSELHVFQPQTAFLEYIQASESFWLNESLPDSPTNHQKVEFLGWVIANALMHECALQLRLHPLLFALLRDWRRTITLDDLKSLDPSLHAAMEQLRCMKPAEFASYVEFEGHSPLMSVDEYTAQTIDEKYGSKSSIAWQLQEVRRGFHRVFHTDDLHSCSISAIDLTDHLCGDNQDSTDADFDVAEVFRVSLDPDFSSCEPLQHAFWKAVGGFEPQLKRKLVKFVTGVDTLPQAGTEFFRVEMPFPALSPIECERTLRMLPQSHTCDNTLELPHYWRALCWKHKHDFDKRSDSLESELLELLSEKLRLAAEYSSGYGLDGTKSDGSSLADILPAPKAAGGVGAEQLDIQDSYESLNLPGLGGDSVDGGGESETKEPQQRDELLPLETTDMRRSTPNTNMDDKAPDDEDYGAEDWDVEEEVAE